MPMVPIARGPKGIEELAAGALRSTRRRPAGLRVGQGDRASGEVNVGRAQAERLASAQPGEESSNSIAATITPETRVRWRSGLGRCFDTTGPVRHGRPSVSATRRAAPRRPSSSSLRKRSRSASSKRSIKRQGLPAPTERQHQLSARVNALLADGEREIGLARRIRHSRVQPCDVVAGDRFHLVATKCRPDEALHQRRYLDASRGLFFFATCSAR